MMNKREGSQVDALLWQAWPNNRWPEMAALADSLERDLAEAKRAAEYWEAVAGQFSEFEEAYERLKEASGAHCIEYEAEADRLNCYLCQGAWKRSERDQHKAGCPLIPPGPFKPQSRNC